MGKEEEGCKYAYSYHQIVTLVEVGHSQVWSLCESSKKDIIELSKCLKVGHSLTYLNLESNSIGDSGCQIICEVLKSNRVLKVLGLKNNKIKKVGAKALSGVLEENSTLVCLDLDDNTIGDGGAKALAYALNENEALTELYLKGNGISNSGAMAIASALLENRSLTYLDLDSNEIKEAGAKSLLHALQENTTLTDLYMENNQADKETEIETFLLRNKKIRKRAFKDAVKKGQKGSWDRAKLMVIGQGKSGKTSTVRSLLREPFNPKWDSTIGVALTQVETSSAVSWKKVEGMDSDFALEFAARVAAERLAKSTELKAGLAVARKATDDGDKPASVASRTYSTSTDTSANVSLNGFPEVEAEDKEEKLDSLFVSARRSLRIQPLRFSVWDLGGQKVFYSMHHLFLTRYAIYLIVFDMRKMLQCEETTIRYLKFWMNSVNLHASEAPVILVGTFYEEVEAQVKLERIEKLVTGKLEIGVKFKQVIRNLDNDLMFFPIDNRTGKGIDSLRSNIELVTRGQDFMHRLVSSRWMCCLDKMLQLQHRSWIYLRDVKGIANGLSISNSEEINSMLALFHELGVIFHLTTTEILRDVVTLKPQWLIDSLSRVIRDGRIHAFEMDTLEKVGLRGDVDQLFDCALASQDLLEYWWGKEHLNFLLDLMRQALLLSDWNFRSENLFLVPSLAPPGSVQQLPGSDLEGKGCVGSTCVFDFSASFLPIGVFQRLVCLCVSRSSRIKGTEEPIMYKKWSRIRFGSEGIIYLEQRDENKILLTVGKDRPASRTLNVIQSMLQKINRDIMNGGLSWTIGFEVKKEVQPSKYGFQRGKNKVRTEILSFEEAKRENLKPWFGPEGQTNNNNEGFEMVTVDIGSFLKNLGD